MKTSEQIEQGIGISYGVAIGPAFVIDQHGVVVPEFEIPVSGIEKEVKRFQGALARAKRQLAQLRQKVQSRKSGGKDIADLLEAHEGMLSGSLARGVEDLIRKKRINAEAAIQQQITILQANFAKLDDPYIAARAADVKDVGLRLIRQLLQQHHNPFADVPNGSIIITEEITPADTALMNPKSIAGFATVLGGAEGHAAIMARGLGMPAVTGITSHGVGTGDIVIIDGRKGKLIIHPDAETLDHYRGEQAKKQREAKKLKSLKNVPSVMVDGTEITLHANLELPRDIDTALESGAAGVGLLRTEFMFMNRPDLPDEDEQYEALKKFVNKLDGRPVTIRTLDVGGEKLATALGEALGESANPALGLRAIRLGLKQPKLLETQLAAILRASAHGPVRILIPMVSSVAQMKKVREALLRVEQKLQKRGVKLRGLPPLGAMIEIPAAALAADALAKVCDFFAIGSNDLTQYTLAIDRGDERVADLYDPFHPAVLRLIQFTTAAAWRANIPVSLCGEIAGNRRATALLVGLGMRELSMAPIFLPGVKQEVVQLSMPQAMDFAEKVMMQTDEGAIKNMLQLGTGALNHSPHKRKRGGRTPVALP